MDEPDLQRRRTAAIYACDRILSHGRQPTMRERLADLTDSGYDLDAAPDAYGDGVVRELEQRVASLLGKPDAAFFPTGTMAQQVVLRWTGPPRTSRKRSGCSLSTSYYRVLIPTDC